MLITTENLFQLNEVTPICMQWKNDHADNINSKNTDIHRDSINIITKEYDIKGHSSNSALITKMNYKLNGNSCIRSSTRQRKVPTNKKDDFLWKI